jgi:hypothetical protein
VIAGSTRDAFSGHPDAIVTQATPDRDQLTWKLGCRSLRLVRSLLSGRGQARPLSGRGDRDAARGFRDRHDRVVDRHQRVIR